MTVEEFVIADTARTNPIAKGQTPEALRALDDIKKSGFVELPVVV